MKDTKIINIVASPCAGKSTLACSLFVYLKKQHLDVEYITEYAKGLVWEENLNKLNNQYYVSCKQYDILKSVYGKVDYIICDSPLFMSLFYNYYNQNNVSDVFKTAEYILDKMDEFKNDQYIFIERDKSLPYNTIGRVHNEQQSDHIQMEIQNLLKCCEIDYIHTITGEHLDSVMDKLNFKK